MSSVAGEARLAPIAVLGYGCVLPSDVRDPERFWDNLLAGRCGISRAPADRWRSHAYFSTDRGAEDASYCRLGGFVRGDALPDVDGPVDAAAAARLNRTQRFMLDCGLQALRGTAYADPAARRACALYLGNILGDEVTTEVAMHDDAMDILTVVQAGPALRALPADDQRRFAVEYTAAVADAYPSRAALTAGDAVASGLAPAVASVLGMAGPAVLVDGACASGLLVVDVAVRALQERAVPAVLAVGATANLGIVTNVSFAKIGGLSPNACRPLDADADGLIPSEGGAAVLLKRLDDAVRDGDIDHVEVHAAGTPSGDGEEIQAILNLVGPARPDGRRVSIGSVKSLIGHSFPAAGMANLVAVLLCLDHGVIAPTHRIERLRPLLDANRDRLVVHTSAVAWPDTPGRPRRAVANACGSGGANASVCVEAYDEDYHRAVLADGRRQIPPARCDVLAVIGMGIVEPTERDTHSIVLRCADGDAAGDGGLDFPWRAIRIPPVSLPDLDRSQQMALMAASAALRQAEDHQAEAGAGDQAGVFVGAATGLEIALARNLRVRLVEIVELIERLLVAASVDRSVLDGIHASFLTPIRAGIRPTTANAMPGYMDSIVAGRIANMFDLQGPSMVADTDVTSFASAIVLARSYLAQGESRVAVVGAVSANRTPLLADALLPDRGPAATAMATEVAVMFVIKPLPDVRPAGRILGVITDCAPARVHEQRARRAQPPRPEDLTCLGASGARWLWRALAEGRPGNVFIERVLQPGSGHVLAVGPWPR